VAAGVVLDGVEVALRARQHVKPQGRLETLADAVCGAVLAWMQRAALGVLAEVLPEYILQSRSH
jgi:hypothetical protein